MNRKLRNSHTKVGFGLASSLVVLAGALASHAATAQDATVAPDTTLTEEIIVTGTRANLQNAQDIKREADTFVDALSAEDIGSLPDRSVLEALQRLPGVSIERFAGPDDPDHFSVEGSGALIRGMTQTRSEFNGRDSFTASSGRGLSFQDVSPELMGGVDVYKNQTADMIEGGIGGTITLRTRKPFDSANRQMAFNIDYSYGDKAEQWSPTVSGLFSDRWETAAGEFGFLISVADSQLYGESHGIQSDAYSQYYAENLNDESNANYSYSRLWESGILPGAERFVEGAAIDERPTVWMPNSANLTQKYDDRKRQGLTTSMQWQNLDETIRVTGEYIRSDSNLTWDENAIKYQGGYPLNSGNLRSAPLDGTSITFDDDGVFQSGTLKFVEWLQSGNGDHAPGSGTSGYQFGAKVQPDSRVVITESLVEDMSLNAEWQPTDKLELSFDYQYIQAESSQDDIWLMLGTFAGQEFDISGDTPTLTFIEPWFGHRDANRTDFYRDYPGFSDDPEGDANYFQDPNNYFWRAAMDHYERSEGVSAAMRIDGTYHFNDEHLIKSVSAGVRYADREQIVRRTSYNWNSVAPEWSSAARAGWVMDEEYASQYQYLEYTDWSDFHGGDAFHVEGNQTIHPSGEFVRMLMGANPERELIVSRDSENNPVGAWEEERLPARSGVDTEYGLFTPGDISYTREQNEAFYMRLDFAGDEDLRFSGNVGFRYATLTRQADGAVVYPDLIPQHAAPADIDIPLTSASVISYLDQQVANGIFPDITAARGDAINQWVGEESNYLSDDDRNYGNNAELPTAAKTEFKLFLPSFNLKLELTDDLISRFAISRAAAYPDLGDVRNRVSIGTLNTLASTRLTDLEPLENGDPSPYEGMIDTVSVRGWTGGGGNPFLKPMMSTQYDISLEWYFSDVGQLSGTLFHKNLDDYFVKGSNYQYITNPLSNVTQLVDVDSTINGGNAKMDGFELSYQQFFEGKFEGFGVQATYTYIDASGVPNNQIEFEEEVARDSLDNFNDTGIRVSLDSIPLQGQSKETANLAGIFEKDGWNARLAYNWRSRYLLTTRDVISKAPLFYDDHGQLDGSVFYNVTDSLTVGVQATNLTDSQSKTIMVLNNEMLEAGRSWFVSDRRIALVVKGNF
ncbi:TonB-dependent receptor [Teredinibacter purpureus]|uniref:TonB-dependent receptor n=1 Tax=Teredinibacter purpureus TaxID=2731756 RepID=UPI0005F86DEB|nr:TonB-dependent receptor [Teredinibacter purpureus]